MSSCATNPIWLVKTRLQLDRSHSSLPMVIRRIHAEGGIFSFWKGLTASWWGISETVIHFVIYEFLKKSLAEHQNKKKDADKTALDFVGFMACGATSKTCATCVAYPHGEYMDLVCSVWRHSRVWFEVVFNLTSEKKFCDEKY